MSFSTVFSRQRTGLSFSRLSRSRKSNAERSVLLRLLAVLFLAGSVGLLGGCDMGGSGSLDYPEGTFTDSFGGSYTIESTTIDYSSGFGGSYSAEIVSIDENQLNAGDTAITKSAADAGDEAINPGHAVIRYTSVSDASWGQVDKYNVFRWADGPETNEMYLAQGGKYTGTYPNLVMTVFDTPDAAKSGATNANGFFDPGLSPMERQD